MDDAIRKAALKNKVNEVLAVTEEAGCKKIVPQGHCASKRRFAERLRRFFRDRVSSVSSNMDGAGHIHQFKKGDKP